MQPQVRQPPYYGLLLFTAKYKSDLSPVPLTSSDLVVSHSSEKTPAYEPNIPEPKCRNDLIKCRISFLLKKLHIFDPNIIYY